MISDSEIKAYRAATALESISEVGQKRCFSRLPLTSERAGVGRRLRWKVSRPDPLVFRVQHCSGA